MEVNADNSGWTGTLHIYNGEVSINHVGGLGATAAGTVLHGGALRLNAATMEPIHVLGGVLSVNDSVADVTLDGGAVRIGVDRPIAFLQDDSSGGEVQLDLPKFSSSLLLPATSVADSGFALVGIGNGVPPYEGRLFIGSLAFRGPSASNLLRLGSRDEFLTVEVPLLRANHIGAIEIVEGHVELAGEGDYPGPTIVASGATLRASRSTSLGTSSGHEEDATIVRAARYTASFGRCGCNRVGDP